MAPTPHSKSPLAGAPPRAALRMAAMLATILLAACAAVGPDYRTPAVDAPADWTAWHGGDASLMDPALRQPADAIAVRDLSALFKDPVLDALQAKAAGANLDLRTAALRFAQSRVQRQTVAAQHGPQVGARAAVSRQRQSEYGSGTRLLDAIAPAASRDQLVSVLSDPYSVYQAGFDASWELDLWGRVRRSIEAADANVDASSATLAQVRLGIEAELARQYFELRGVQRRLRLTRDDIAASTESLELVQARADAGLTDDLDVVRQQTQVADLNSRLPGLLDQEAQAINQLTLLTGERPGALQGLLAARNDAAEPPGLPDLALGVPSGIALRRPDIQAAQARLHAATAGIGIATADLYPRLTLGASFGLESLTGNRFGDWGSRQWSVGPSLDLPIFDHGRRRATIALRALEQQEAAVAYQQTVLGAWHEIDSALTGYTAERQRLQYLAEKTRRSADAYELAKARYRNGLTDFLVELDAQRTLLQAQRDYAQSSSMLAVRLVSIYKALGGAAPAGLPG